jgi:hypothetical protein
VPDMSSTVTFLESKTDKAVLAEAKSRLYVPLAAVRKDGQENAVFVLEGDVVRRTPLQLGTADKERVEVLSGLTGGETIARSGIDRLQDGQRVRKKQG